MTCKDCFHHKSCFNMALRCGYKAEALDGAEICEDFKNKADFIEVVRCKNCKYGDVSTHSKSKDGEEVIACLCRLKKRVTDVDSYCPSGRRRSEI